MLLDAGAIVTGSEVNPNAQTFELVKRGAKVSRDQIGELLSSEVDLVVRTAAVPDTNPEYIAAGRLIDSMGLKGTTCGNAAVSEVHGNFVVNQGGATATEITTLIDFLQREAKTERSVTLETEIKILGDDEPTF